MPSSSLKSPNDKGDGSGRTIPALYQTFEKEKDPSDKKSNINKEKPKTGYTIFVQGKGVTEDSLKKHFNDYGNIVNVSMEIEKNRGFVTFSKTEATDRAIAEVSAQHANVQLQLANNFNQYIFSYVFSSSLYMTHSTDARPADQWQSTDRHTCTEAAANRADQQCVIVGCLVNVGDESLAEGPPQRSPWRCCIWGRYILRRE